MSRLIGRTSPRGCSRGSLSTSIYLAGEGRVVRSSDGHAILHVKNGEPSQPLASASKLKRHPMAHPIPEDPDSKLRCRVTAEALAAKGYPTSEKTLATKATRGGGPPHQLFGRIPLYRWGDALAWAESKLSAPRHSTSEADAHHQSPA